MENAAERLMTSILSTMRPAHYRRMSMRAVKREARAHAYRQAEKNKIRVSIEDDRRLRLTEDGTTHD